MTVLTFPTDPTPGQRYNAPNQIQYVYDGVKWIVETVASTSLAVTNSVQDRVAPMLVAGPHNGIAFTYNAGTNALSASITALNGDTLVNGVHELTLESTGAVTLPTLTVPISDNATPSGTGQTLKFNDSTQQAIIFGPEALSLSSPSAQRVIIQGAPGFTGTTGEGGDVYLWAGPGGSLNGNGGDIKVRAGQGNGTGSGGYLNFQAGDSGTGSGGYINIESGYSNTYGSGGDITVQANRGGEVYIRTYFVGGTNNWLFGNNGVLTLPNNGTINDYVGSAGVLGILIDRTFQTPNNANSANFGTDTVKLLLSDGEAAEIVSYLTASIGVRVWFNQGNNYPITSCVQVSTGIWTVTATGMGNTFATFAASNTLIFIYTGATPNTYTNFPQYVPVGDGAGITISKGGNTWTFNDAGALTFPQGTTIATADGTDAFIIDGAVGKDVQIYTYGNDVPNGWTFGADGNLTLPAGGAINNSDGLILSTNRGTLAIGTNMEVPGVAQHFHIAFNGSNSNPPASDLFFGDDHNYVKLPGYQLNPATFGVEIGTDNRNLGPQNIEVGTVDELVPPGGVWRFFIDHDTYPNLGSAVSVGDTVTTSWGTPITATITDVVEEPGNWWKIHVAQDITAGFSGGDTVSFGASGLSHTWRFGTDGDLHIPPGKTIRDAMTGDDLLAGAGGSGVGPLPSWITVVPGTHHLPTLNTDYGWNSLGAWTVNATIGEDTEGTSYPFRTTFSIPNDTKSVTTVDFVVADFGADFGIGVFAAGTNPVWLWPGPGSGNPNRIGAQYNGSNPELHGISGGDDNDYDLSGNGTYRARLTVDPTGPGTADITFETLDTSNNVLDTITYTETEFFGTNYKIGFASDQDNGTPRTYFKNLTINIDNGATVYTDTLMNGSSVGTTDQLVNGAQEFTLNTDGSVTFPDGSIQTTAYTGGNLNTWVQTFETSLRTADVPVLSNSVEYLANGDVVALINHLKDIDSGLNNINTYCGVARFDTIGRLVWSMNFQGNDEFEIFTDGWGLAVDNANGYIYVAGTVGGFGGPGSGIATLTKLGQATGSVEWSKTYDVGYDNTNTVVDVAADGNPVVVGYADNGDDNQVVTTKINANNGAVIWSRALDGQNNENAYGMAVGPNGEVVAVGYMDNIEYPGPVNTILTLTASPASDPDWVNNLTGVTNGGLTFDVSFTAGVPTFTNIVDTTGNHYVGEAVGMISSASLGSGSTNLQFIVGTTTTEDLSDRMLIVKYAGDGTIEWQKSVQVEADYDCTGADADIDSTGNIYVCGNFDQDGDSAMIIIKFNSLGVKQWSRKVEGNCGNFATSIVVGPDDHLYLSAVTDAGAFPNHDYKMVIAKYNLDGIVSWQRLLDSTTTQTFAGAFWFNGNGGSNLAVRDGYVAVAGSFGEVNGPFGIPSALIAQFSTEGTVFEIGNYEFSAATFSGTLNGSASNITVANAAKTDSNFASSFTVTDFTPAVDLTGDLIGTLYYGDSGSDDRLTNGANNLVLTPAGAVTLPRGGTISEGVVTSNPTIQLMPARPDVVSQKLVIKGGGIGSYVKSNGLVLGWNYTNTNIGDTINFTVYSDTYVGQTLYWWVYPENAGLVDVEQGQVIVPPGGNPGFFNILIDSVDYEFTVRVSPENNNYDPDNVGVESYLFNGEAPTYPEHHLHLTTGNLAETSVFLGTDNHNIRTITDGGIQVTTQTTTVELPHTITITGADVAGVNLVYTRDPVVVTPTWKSPNINPATDPYIRFLAGQWGIVAPDYDPVTPLYVNTGTIAVPLAQWSTNPPFGSVAPLGVYTYLTPDVHAWTFGIDGTTTFPTLTVPISDNTTPNGTGQTLKFSDSSQQAIIFGPVSTGSSPSAERIIIQGAPGYTGTTGEGGDIYLWAGPGGSTNGDGGDIKVRAGYGPGTGQGGYLNFQAGDSATGNGGLINIEGGQSNTYGLGGDVTVQAHDGGEIFLRTHNSITTQTWTLGADGTTTFPGAVVKGTVAKTGGGIDTETDIDLTKSVNKLTGGIYTLADGVEGQIMYLVKQTGTAFDTVTVIVANARVGGVLYTFLEHYPFSYNTSSIDIDTLIFTDGAWQAVGGEWD